MSAAVWFSLLAAASVISLTPGAGALNTMSNALAVGWRRSIWGILGQQLALLVHVVIVAAGVGVLVAGSPLLFAIIRYLGAAYLAYLGVRLLVASSLTVESSAGSVHAEGESARIMFLRGFWVNLSNPKAIVFFLAFVPQFVRPDSALLPQYLVLTVTVVVVDILVMYGVFATAARPLRRFTTSGRGQRILNTTFGTLFLALAGLLAFSAS